ncbi:MAG TPA: lipoyl(octanoyl) transferase [Gemmatimonadetes bacterium]|jgi:lipoyl(octanoyl) transferase|uniref:lipoyl(octanoyl) transferase n=1 Tax=marine metagenome TaxID=408172 RepID=A0A381PPA5_9ZZZZ|nr:lipoyl(octanoyl) transferase LipB [Gemmatimonadota bacterium]HAT16634.1 lipoyl(octanoyl) transferase [Gemmatimonadota bacterium]HAW90519.1 lipoyl(octanoyl) transferase [Gemmatimonadota bacterium]|tara:strand:+ start:3509 stop:4165 length:657 start_codon:yes stop_codon:yes gene_type:complete
MNDAIALEVQDLGLVPYAEALALQSDLVGRRRAGDIPDQLLLLQHPHVITLGTASSRAHIVADQSRLQELGIDLVDVGRGGDVTYHGPGQLVGYPILDLEPDRKDVHRYLRDLESVLVHTLGEMGIQGEPVPDLTGVWVDGRKIAAIGVRISSGWITSHGFALNVSNDLSFFETIVPCGIQDVSVTSVSQELGRPVGVPDILGIVSRAFSEVFGRSIS